MQARRDQFMRLYRAHKYPDPIRTLQSLMSECEKFMDWIELDKVRNDLAISQYHKRNKILRSNLLERRKKP